MIKSVSNDDFSLKISTEGFVSELIKLMELNQELNILKTADKVTGKLAKMFFSIIHTNLSIFSGFLNLLEQKVMDENDKVQYVDLSTLLSGMQIRLR